VDLSLIAEPEALAARRENVQVRAPLDELRHLRRGGQQPLEVVQEEKQLAIADMRDEVVLRAEGACDRLKHELRFPERRKIDPEDARLKLRHQLGRSLERESCLPGTARAGEGDETRAAADAHHDFGDVCLAADEGTRRSREVRVRDRLERRKLPLPELEERNRLVEVLQPVLAQVDDWGTVVEVVPRRLREKRLAPVPGCADPGGQVDVESDVSLGDPRRLARVDSDPDTNRPLGKLFLRIERSGGCVGCGSERDEERVPLRIHLDPCMRSKRRAQVPSVLGERAGVSVAQLAQ
jgi:hypothetical protein